MEAYFRRARFDGCKAEGANFAAARLHETALVSASFRYANFTGGVWERVRAQECRFTQAALSSLRLSRSAFSACDLSGADLFKTPLAGLDLSTCELAGLALSDDCSELRGASVSALQAPEIVRLLGVRVV